MVKKYKLTGSSVNQSGGSNFEVVHPMYPAGLGTGIGMGMMPNQAMGIANIPGSNMNIGVGLTVPRMLFPPVSGVSIDGRSVPTYGMMSFNNPATAPAGPAAPAAPAGGAAGVSPVLQKKITDLEAEIKKCNDEKKKLSTDKDSNAIKIRELEQQISKCKKDLGQCEIIQKSNKTVLQQNTEHILKLQKEIKTLKSQGTDMQAQIQDKEGELQAARQSITDLRAEQEQARQVLEARFGRDTTELTRRLVELDQRAREERTILEASVTAFTQELTQLRAQKAGVDRELADCLGNVTRLEGELTTLESKSGEMVTLYETQLSTIRQQSSVSIEEANRLARQANAMARVDAEASVRLVDEADRRTERVLTSAMVQIKEKQAALVRAQADLRGCEERIISLQAQISATADENTAARVTLQGQLQAAEQARDTELQKVSYLDAEIGRREANFAQKYAQVGVENQELRTRTELAESRSGELQRQIEAAGKEITGLRGNNTELLEAIRGYDETKAVLRRLQAENERLNGELRRKTYESEECEGKFKKCDEDMRSLQEQLNEKLAELRRASTQATSDRGTIERLTSEARDLAGQKATLQAEKDRLTGINAQLTTDKGVLIASKERLEEQSRGHIAAYEESRKAKVELEKEYKTRLAGADRRIKQLEVDLSIREEELEHFVARDASGEYEAELAKLRAQIEKLKKDIANQTSAFELEKVRLRETYNRQKDDLYRQHKIALDASQTATRTAEADTKAARVETRAAQQDTAAAIAQIATLRPQIEELTARARACDQQLEAIREQLASGVAYTRHVEELVKRLQAERQLLRDELASKVSILENLNRWHREHEEAQARMPRTPAPKSGFAKRLGLMGIKTDVIVPGAAAGASSAPSSRVVDLTPNPDIINAARLTKEQEDIIAYMITARNPSSAVAGAGARDVLRAEAAADPALSATARSAAAISAAGTSTRVGYKPSVAGNGLEGGGSLGIFDSAVGRVGSISGMPSNGYIAVGNDASMRVGVPIIGNTSNIQIQNPGPWDGKDPSNFLGVPNMQLPTKKLTATSEVKLTYKEPEIKQSLLKFTPNLPIVNTGYNFNFPTFLQPSEKILLNPRESQARLVVESPDSDEIITLSGEHEKLKPVYEKLIQDNKTKVANPAAPSAYNITDVWNLNQAEVNNAIKNLVPQVGEPNVSVSKGSKIASVLPTMQNVFNRAAMYGPSIRFNS
jgi:chromosome segregation ATPase